jgi:hypothetical protein
VRQALGVFMRVSDIKASILAKSVSGGLRKSLDRQVPKYQESLSKVGSSVTIHAVEDTELEVGMTEVRELCRFFISESVSDLELAYIADAMQLCDCVNFGNEEVADYISEFTDPEINGVFTKQRAKQIVTAHT